MNVITLKATIMSKTHLPYPTLSLSLSLLSPRRFCRPPQQKQQLVLPPALPLPPAALALASLCVDLAEDADGCSGILAEVTSALSFVSMGCWGVRDDLALEEVLHIARTFRDRG